MVQRVPKLTTRVYVARAQRLKVEFILIRFLLWRTIRVTIKKITYSTIELNMDKQKTMPTVAWLISLSIRQSKLNDVVSHVIVNNMRHIFRETIQEFFQGRFKEIQ